MNLRSWRGSTPLSPSPRRNFPWGRIILILVVLGIAAYVVVPNYLYTTADGLVQGNLVPVTPLYRVRLDKLLVNCSDHVSVGQKLAVVSNFLVQADYDRQYQQSVAQMQLSQIALDQGVAAAQTNAQVLEEKYNASVHDAERLKAALAAYDEGYQGGGISRVDWEAKQSEYKSALALEASNFQAWQYAKQQVRRIGVDQNAKISKDQQLSEQAQTMSQRLGSETIVAPVSGYIVNCVDRPENVIEPSSAIFTIFQPERAYVLAYFAPTAMAKIHLNQVADVTIPGVKAPLAGRVAAVYPDLAKLPSQLTRYFWQHQQWTQYRPVRIVFDKIPAEDRAQLFYDAQVRVKMRND